jgi:predicted enzyme related to lactoylglutathione lyase
MTVLRKIDCVMVKVSDLGAAADFYQRVFGLTPLWTDATSVGMGMPDTDAEVVLHTREIAVDRAVTYLVDDVDGAVQSARAANCGVLEEPFDIPVGRCAVLRDPFGNPVCILDLSKGGKTGNSGAAEPATDHGL